MRIININGPINSGKSTVSKLLVQKFANALFIEVDDLLSDEEQETLGLNLEQGWQERTNRLDNIIKQEKAKKTFDTIIFAYPITQHLYNQYKKWEDSNTDFINITLAPSLQICTRNRGDRMLKIEEIERIKQMYKENYHRPECSNLIIDNSNQTPMQTVEEILNFLKGN
ncbi:MAG: adenylyl-sulfate kinase, partial [Alphaproteobacteria bacterium]|nr:adenylyl-sulfate kinase [Alphaproteobacteria bacterium]